MINDSFVYSKPGQRQRTLSVHLEDPRLRRDAIEAVWDCRVEIPGHWEAVLLSGRSPLHATCVALCFVRKCLENLQAEGTLCYPNGTEVRMESLFPTHS